jgi:hypothetical protein
MNPLPVARCLGKRIDSVLIDQQPGANPKLLADVAHQLRDCRDSLGRAMYLDLLHISPALKLICKVSNRGTDAWLKSWQ